MPKQSFSLEQIIAKLRQIEVLVAHGKSVAIACKEAGISEQMYYRWRKLAKTRTTTSSPCAAPSALSSRRGTTSPTSGCWTFPVSAI